LLQLGQFRPFQAGYAILTYRRMNCLYQLRLAERLVRKSIAPPFIARRRNVAMSSEEYDGWVISIGNLLLKLQAVDITEFHVQNQAGRKVGPRKVAVLGGRPKRVSAQPPGRQEFTKRFTHVLVVIHDEDDLLFHHHCDALGYAERVSASMARRVSILVARSRPAQNARSSNCSALSRK
jgi:hypothetical protein